MKINVTKHLTLGIIFTILLLNNSELLIAQSFKVSIQTSLKGDPETIPTATQTRLKVGVIKNPDGERAQFVEGEIILKPKDEDEKQAILKRWKGVIVSDGTIPDPPQKFEHLRRNIPKTSSNLRIRVNTEIVDTQQGLIDNANKYGLKGKYTFSSIEMLQLFGLFLEELVNGVKGIDLNGVFTLSECFNASTQEYAMDPSAPNPALANEGYMDAFDMTQLNDPTIAVTQAWQLVELYGTNIEVVPTCLIDVGFWLNDDFPTSLGYDFVGEDYNVDADEEGYHGTRTLSIACARLDNRFGSAGTGGLVALPMPFRFDLTYFMGEWAIRTAVDWGAKIISQSWGGSCNWWCDTFGGFSGETALNEALDGAWDAGVALLASAGNSETNLNDAYILPAEGGTGGRGNIVVGALDLATKNAIATATHGWGSSFGNALDTWIAVWPRITSTPTPADPTISTIGRTSGACAYAAGVVSMMFSLCPGLTVREVNDIVDDANEPSADPRVASGYLNALEAVQLAAAHGGAIDPSIDDWEPNDHTDFLQIYPDEHCANLSSVDTEDGYYFWVDDIRPVQVTDTRLFLGEYTAIISGFGIDPDESLPFDGELVPGAYYIHYTRTSATPCFYQLDLNIDDPIVMLPDRFEVNDDLTTPAELTFPELSIGDTWAVEDINFHVRGDPDYFELVLPELSNPLYTDRLTLWVEPEDRTGFSSSTQLYVYDESDAIDPSVRGLACTITNFSSSYPGGRIRFLVDDGLRHRNYYRILIGYDQYVRGVEEPSTFAFYYIPDWIPDPSDLFLLHILRSPLDGLPLDLPFPGDPSVAEVIAAGKPPQTVNPEVLILKWPEMNNFGMDLSYTGLSQEMEISLMNDKGDIIAKASDVLKKTGDNSSNVIKRMKYEKMERGIYGIKVEGSRFPMIYRIELDKVEITSIKENADDIVPSSFTVSQNYPNPFNSVTKIRFSTIEPGQVVFKVYDINGREVFNVENRYSDADYHEITFDAEGLSSGIYFYYLEMNKNKVIRKMVYMK